jgi:hypothetical protein
MERFVHFTLLTDTQGFDYNVGNLICKEIPAGFTKRDTKASKKWTRKDMEGLTEIVTPINRR